MDAEKKERLEKITEMLAGFCDQFLDEKYFNYSMKLLERLSRKRNIDITKGGVEIWAASIMHVIARLNYLNDKNNPFYFTLDELCEYFETKKSTTGNKASFIIEICMISLGEEGLCSPEITDMFTYYETPVGFIIPKSMIGRIGITTDEESAEIETYRVEQEIIKNEKEQERKRLNEERKQKIRESKEKDQLRLFE